MVTNKKQSGLIFSDVISGFLVGVRVGGGAPLVAVVTKMATDRRRIVVAVASDVNFFLRTCK
jgi:uncharacterized membrane protein